MEGEKDVRDQSTERRKEGAAALAEGVMEEVVGERGEGVAEKGGEEDERGEGVIYAVVGFKLEG